jgi:hypothetical protein
MSVQEITRIIKRYLEEGEDTFRHRYGPEAATAIEDLIAVLEIRLREGSAYTSLWDDFAAEPRATEDQLIGALEALIEADPALAQRLAAFFEEYRDATTRTPAERGVNLAPRESPPPHLPASPDDYSEVGTYLYGNLSPGTVTLDESGRGVVSAGEPDITVATPRVGQGIALFQDMYVFVAENEDLGEDTRLKLRAELEQLAIDIAEGKEEYEQSIVRHLDAVRRLSSEVYRRVMDKLANVSSGLAPVVQRVVRRLLTIN